MAGKAYWCQLAEIVKQEVKCNQFPDVWKGGIMCDAPRKPGVPLTPERLSVGCKDFQTVADWLQTRL